MKTPVPARGATQAAAWLLSAAALLSTTPLQAQTPQDSQVRVSSFDYDPTSGLLIRETLEPEHPADCLQTTYTHDTNGNRTSASSAACPGASGHTLSSANTARTSTTQYTAQTTTLGGQAITTPAGTFPSRSTNPLGHSETREHDPRHGGTTRLTGPNGLTTTWTYDPYGRKTLESRADGTTTTWTYRLCQPPGQPRDPLCPTSVGPHTLQWYASETSHDTSGSPLGPTRYQFHDTLDRPVRIQTLDFHGQTIVQDTHYNALGQISQTSTFYRLSGGTPHWSTTTYDRLGRVSTQTQPDSNGTQALTRITYNGLSTTTTNPLGQTQTTHKTPSGQTARITDPLGNDITYTHDALGQLTQTQASGSLTRISYSRRGHKLRQQDPAMGAWDYAYNAFGELVWQQDSLGQATTIAYDPLGRMTQRSEPDLTSRWHHDQRADGSACGKSIGQLCEARTDNGYRRLHSYDSLGRPSSTSTTLDNASAPATLSHTYHSQSGRIATQTWPTGYQASYTYNTHGYLSQVSAAAQGGTSAQASLQVLAMDPQGHITQYRQGNNVTTVKTHDPASGRLQSVQASNASGQGSGSSSGNVLSHTYTYDSLGNLLTRNDANTGVRESYQYDSLNRLSLYTVLGGSLSATQAIQTLYDAAGNLKYKSDVGYYHHDPLRPQRLNHITLTPGSGWSALGAVTQPNSGTRALSYAYDDSRSGAKSIATPSGTQPMGNGNLWYTVSQDQASGRHTVRWESYTSFNMPSDIRLGNLSTGQTSTPATLSGYTCPAGFTLQGGNNGNNGSSNNTCVRGALTQASIAAYSCPSGYRLEGNRCIGSATTTSSTPASAQYTCPAGYQINGTTTCTQINTSAATAYCLVPGSTVNTTYSRCEYGQRIYEPQCATIGNPYGARSIGFWAREMGGEGDRWGTCFYATSYSCPAGQTLSGTNCTQTLTQAATLSYSCPAGTSLSGTQCTVTSSAGDTLAASPTYTCPPGTTLKGNTCEGNTPIETRAATPAYTCPSGLALDGSTCTNPTSNALAERTLSFAYGPEHQRIRQTVALTSSAPSTMQAGTTWYLNGTDSQGLTYEKETKANGTTEHKHYLSAAGITFALYIQREGSSLNGQPATSLHYLHHDHLGSIAAITNESGQLTERLAYDPWGKRRNANGTPDPLDALYGVATERGYTQHEHLDEMGIVHMNGRLYDPLIARFMSADPFIQFPANLQSHNRYSYVLNNPLAFTDPSGYFSFKKLVGALICPFCIKEFRRPIIAAVVAYYTGQWVLGMTGSPVIAGAAGGFNAGVINGGSLKAGLQGAFSGSLFGAAGLAGGPGAAGANSAARYAAHAAAGCISAVAGGGKCGPGASSALFGKFTTNHIGGLSQDPSVGEIVGKGVATTVAGGIGSVIGGGKFANGAETAAYGYLFNAMQQEGWGRPDTLQDHFDRHGSDFAAKNPTDYAQKAQDFRESALKNPRTEFRIDADGTLRIYDRMTNTFGSYNSDGSTKTFYKPSTGERYWDSPKRGMDWGEKIDTGKPANLTRVGRAIRVIRIIGGNLE